jgi:prophage regulatory protein
MTTHDCRPPNSEGRDRIVRMRELAARMALSSSHLYALIRSGRFPKPVSLVPGGRAKGWTEQELSNWLRSRVQLRDSSNPNPTPSAAATAADASLSTHVTSTTTGGRS